MTAEDYFKEILNEIPDASLGKMFGRICAKMPNGKAGMILRENTLIVKLSPEEAEENCFKLFTPKEGRPMNGWYEINFEDKAIWKQWAEISCTEVAKLPAKEKKPKK